MGAAGMYAEMLTPRTSVLVQTLSSAAFDFTAEEGAPVRPVPASAVRYWCCSPGSEDPAGDGAGGAAGGAVCPAGAHVVNIPS